MENIEVHVDPQNTPSQLRVEDWGLVDYGEAEQRQLHYVQQVQDGLRKDTLVFCTHPPVVTLGRASKKEEDLIGWNGDVHEVQRGGRATYHGPSQMIAYPILDLKKRGSDLHKYLRNLENVLISCLSMYGVQAEGGREDATGVWIGSKKIASIGIGVKKWVSFHGIAMNLHHDPKAFQGINPCGFSTAQMTNLEDLLGQKISHKNFQMVFENFFKIQFL
ncbi:MAG: lipoyl(octanoyl) transferase LipB [Bdellovibrionales bacterium]